MKKIISFITAAAITVTSTTGFSRPAQMQAPNLQTVRQESIRNVLHNQYLQNHQEKIQTLTQEIMSQITKLIGNYKEPSNNSAQELYNLINSKIAKLSEEEKYVYYFNLHQMMRDAMKNSEWNSEAYYLKYKDSQFEAISPFMFEGGIELNSTGIQAVILMTSIYIQQMPNQANQLELIGGLVKPRQYQSGRYYVKAKIASVDDSNPDFYKNLINTSYLSLAMFLDQKSQTQNTTIKTSTLDKMSEEKLNDKLLVDQAEMETALARISNIQSTIDPSMCSEAVSKYLISLIPVTLYSSYVLSADKEKRLAADVSTQRQRLAEFKKLFTPLQKQIEPFAKDLEAAIKADPKIQPGKFQKILIELDNKHVRPVLAKIISENRKQFPELMRTLVYTSKMNRQFFSYFRYDFVRADNSYHLPELEKEFNLMLDHIDFAHYTRTDRWRASHYVSDYQLYHDHVSGGWEKSVYAVKKDAVDKFIEKYQAFWTNAVNITQYRHLTEGSVHKLEKFKNLRGNLLKASIVSGIVAAATFLTKTLDEKDCKAQMSADDINGVIENKETEVLLLTEEVEMLQDEMNYIKVRLGQ